MSNSEIRQHKEMAMGKDIGYGSCDTAFKSAGGDDGSGKSKSMKDGKRGLKHLGKYADHGPHGMNEPRDGDDY